MKQQRVLRVNTRKAGGSASKKALKYSIAIPSQWVRELELDQGQIEISRSEDGKIIIQKRLPYDVDDFLLESRAAGHKVRIYHYYDGEALCSKIAVDFTAEQVAVANYVDDVLKTAFGINLYPSWEDFLAFLEDRCIPRTRDHVDQYLQALNLTEYSPVQIVEKTQGRMMEDNHWIKIV